MLIFRSAFTSRKTNHLIVMKGQRSSDRPLSIPTCIGHLSKNALASQESILLSAFQKLIVFCALNKGIYSKMSC